MKTQFKPIKAPKRTPKPLLPIDDYILDTRNILGARRIMQRLLRDMRWDDQGGYVSRHNGRWDFVSTGLGQVTPAELDMLFEFVGMTPDEIEIVGNCADCANSNDGHERGYSAPCVSCLRPSHINNFVPLSTLVGKVRKL